MNKKQKKANPVENKANRIAINKVNRTVKSANKSFNPTKKGYFRDGYRYKSKGKEDPTGSKPLCCTRYGRKNNPCPARAVLKNGVFKFGKQKHNHSPDKVEEYVHRFKTEMFDAVTVPSRIEMKNVFDLRKVKYRQASKRWPYETAARSLFRWRAAVLGKGLMRSQRTITAFLELLGTEQGKKLRTYAIGGGEDDEEQIFELQYAGIKCGQATHIVFYEPALLEMMKDCKTWNMDATYRVALKYTKNTQLLTILGRTSGKALPMIWVLMPRRTAKDYKAVFSHIKEKFPFLQPETIICDFEKALESAAKEVFQCHIQGCYFHHAQAIFRQAVKKKFAHKKNNKDKNPEKHAYLQKIIALALLPPDKIEGMFNKLEREIKEKFPCSSTNKFLDYYRQTWILGYKPAGYSVYGTSIRTNNSAEAYHRQVNKYANKKITEEIFLGMLTDLCKANLSDLDSLKFGNKINSKTKVLVYLIREESLQHAWKMYQDQNEKDYGIEKLFEVCSGLVSNFTDDFQYTILDFKTRRDVQNFLSYSTDQIDNDEALQEVEGESSTLQVDDLTLSSSLQESDDDRNSEAESGEDFEDNYQHWDGQKLEECDKQEEEAQKLDDDNSRPALVEIQNTCNVIDQQLDVLPSTSSSVPCMDIENIVYIENEEIVQSTTPPQSPGPSSSTEMSAVSSEHCYAKSLANVGDENSVGGKPQMTAPMLSETKQQNTVTPVEVEMAVSHKTKRVTKKKRKLSEAAPTRRQSTRTIKVPKRFDE